MEYTKYRRIQLLENKISKINIWDNIGDLNVISDWYYLRDIVYFDCKCSCWKVLLKSYQSLIQLISYNCKHNFKKDLH